MAQVRRPEDELYRQQAPRDAAPPMGRQEQQNSPLTEAPRVPQQQPSWSIRDAQMNSILGSAEQQQGQEVNGLLRADSLLQQLNGESADPQAGMPFGREEAEKAIAALQKYKAGRTQLEERIVREEEWYKLNHQRLLNTDPNVAKPTSAWLLNVIMSKHADAMDNFPQANIRPREDSDRDSARIIEKILPAVLESAEFEEIYSYNWWDKLKHGASAYGVFWDSTKENGLGDISIQSVDLLNLYWQPGVRDIQESRYLFILGLEDNDALDARYPEKKGKVRSSGIDIKEYTHDDYIDTTDKSVIVDVYYKTENDMGKTLLHYAKLCGSEILFSSENMPEYRETGWYEHGKYPVVLDVLFPEKDTPIGFGYVATCMDPQMYIDELSGYILEHAAESAHQRWWNSTSGSVNEEEFADSRKKIVHVDGTIDEGKLSPISVPSMGSYPLQVLQLKIDEMKETSANRDFGNGGTGAGVTAASAIYALQESGNKVSRDGNAASYRAYRKIITLIVELMRQFYDEARCFRIVEANGTDEFVRFSNAQIKEQPNGIDAMGNRLIRKPAFDVSIIPQKKNPFSTAAANELALQLYGAGFFAPEQAQASLIALDMMEFEGKERVMQQVQQGQTLLNIVQQLQQQMAMMMGMQQQMAAGEQKPQEDGEEKKPVPNKGSGAGSKSAEAQTAPGAAPGANARKRMTVNDIKRAEQNG